MSRLESVRTFEQLFGLICSHGENTAFIHESDGAARTTSYAELEARVAHAAARLWAELGTDAAGRFVGLHLDNCIEWPIVFWGMLKAGYRPLLLDPRASDDTLHDLISRSGAPAVVTDREHELGGGARRLPVHALLAGDVGDRAVVRWEDHVALATSGTTGTTKLVVYRGAALASNVLSAVRGMQESRYLLRPKTVHLAFAPYFHALGLLTLAGYTAMGKITVFLPDRSPSTIKRICARDGVNLIFGVPLMWTALADKVGAEVARKPLLARVAFRSMCAVSLGAQAVSPYYGQQFAQKVLFRSFHKSALGVDTCVVSGAAPTPRRTSRTLTALGLPVLCGYGMTEVPVISIDVGRSLRHRLRGSVGRPYPLLELRVVGGDRGVGEVQVRGPCLYDYELRDGEVVRPERVEGWMATGDLGRLDDGYVHLSGRSKDIIVLPTGEKVHPEAVEDAFAGLPGVEGFASVGLAGKDGSEAVGLVLYLGDGAPDAGRLIELARRVAGVNEQLAIHKRITRLLVSETALPVTTTMKIKRRALKQALEAGTWRYRELSLSASRPDAAPDAAPEPALAPRTEGVASVPSAALGDQVRALVADVLQISAVTLRDEADFLHDLGGDSLKLLELLTRVEQTFGLHAEREALFACTCVRELTFTIGELLAGRRPASAARPTGAERARSLRPVTRIEDDPRFVEMSQRLATVGDSSPFFIPHDSAVRDTSIVGGIELINFASYNYLGLSGHPRVVAATQRATEDLGTSASGSRLLTGEKTLFRQLESELAAWKQTEDALVLVSGHATNVSFVGNFCGESDLLLYDALAHNSVEQGCRLSRSESRAFPHNDARGLDQLLCAIRSRYEKVLIIVEGVYSMDGDVAPIPEFVALKHKHGAFLMVDEAHSAGVLGATGGGVDEHFGLEPGDIDIRMGTLSKSLGSCGGYLAGRANLINYLRHALPGFVFSVGISPPNAAAALEALRVLQEEPMRVHRLQENIRYFVRQARQRGFDTCGAAESGITPILVGDEARAFRLAAALRQRGVFVAPAIYPAVPRGQARLRFCVTSEHRAEQIAYALDTLSSVTSDFGAIPRGSLAGAPPALRPL